MADLGWLRLGQRSRTPVIPKSPTSSERASAHEPDEQRRPMASRGSSYLGLNNRFSFSPEPPTPASTANILIKDQDKVWHNPSLDQMVEALRVILMTHGVLSSIPVEYNCYVLYLIERFHDIQEKLRAANTACDEAKKSCSQKSADFKTVADEWQKRESLYKEEVKRLEVLLARTSRDGLETVTLARTHSVVDRGEPNPRQFVSRLKGLRNQVTPRELASELDTDSDYPIFLGQVPSTNTHVLKALERIEAEDAIPLRSRRPRNNALFPNILDTEKDFLGSSTPERLRRGRT
ncbi:hypothetical protein BJ170DRAFT_85424 [Xylariales sp. AK1849]|nr:hypothetical protein BJ170DRAFT_85424 [Xylariales sp. AK1849]